MCVCLSDAAGSTEKVTEGENKQNENVNSILGRLVLDNRTENKVLYADEKQSFKEEVATDAESAELESLKGNNNYGPIIGQTGYDSLSEAIEFANSRETPVTISLLKNVQQSGSLIISNSVNIKGANHIITTVGTATSGNMAAFDIWDTSTTPINVLIQDLTINSTKHSRVFLLNGDSVSYDNPNTLNPIDLNVTTDGQAFYSNGPNAINVKNCEIKHEGQYAA